MFPTEAIADLPVSTARDMARALLDLNGRRVVDLGCGAGGLTIFLAGQGADTTGIDPDAQRIRSARESASAEDATVHFAVGVAQTLPFADETLDIVVFSNSLHHVPVESIAPALTEAARTLVPGGVLYVTEPVPGGSHFEVQRLWNDETAVRRRAYDELCQAARWGLDAVRELFYAHPARYRSFEEYADDRRARGGHHAAAFATQGEEIRRRFEVHARREDDAFVLDRSTRINLLRKQASF